MVKLKVFTPHFNTIVNIQQYIASLGYSVEEQNYQNFIHPAVFLPNTRLASGEIIIPREIAMMVIIKFGDDVGIG